MDETFAPLLWQNNGFLQTKKIFIKPGSQTSKKTCVSLLNMISVLFSAQQTETLSWFLFTTGHSKIKIHRSVIFQFSAGTEPPKWRWNHHMDQGKQLILLSVNSCNSWRVHFFLHFLSVKNHQQNTVDYWASGDLLKYQCACLHHRTEFKLIFAFYLLQLQNCCWIKLYNNLL